MNEQQVRQIVRSELAAFNSQARFSLNPTQRHTHNNIDSPYAYTPYVIYAGIVQSDGSNTFLPKGWSCVATGTTGVYQITHNLGTSTYFVFATPTQSTNDYGIPVVTVDTNDFYISWGGGGLGATSIGRVSTAFVFTLILVNNTSSQPPTFTSS